VIVFAIWVKAEAVMFSSKKCPRHPATPFNRAVARDGLTALSVETAWQDTYEDAIGCHRNGYPGRNCDDVRSGLWP
jgi:hypothetical protein